jgi:undecaprenyl diphosphate synthase
MQSKIPSLGNSTIQSEYKEGLHVAIIMDGNGRWAAKRGLPRVAGHRAGGTAARRVVERALEIGIRHLTLYAFSADNWRRPVFEINSIFWLLRAFLRLEMERFRKRGVQLEAIGRRDRLPNMLLRDIEDAECATAKGRDLHLRVALDYSSREAITRAACGIYSNACGRPILSAETVGEMLANELTASAGNVDLLIRTGGEKRLSDFLLWESAYAELLFTDRMWPDFDATDLDTALQEFSCRQRRFGGLAVESGRDTAVPAGGAR